MEKYDKDIALDGTNIEDVAAAVGVPIKRNGRSVLFLCPNPEHNDVHFGSCRLSKNRRRIICYACGKSYNAIDVVMMSTGMKFIEAIEYLAEVNGVDKSAYYSREYRESLDARRNGNRRRAEPSKKPVKRLSEEEKVLLGIDNGGTVTAPTAFSYIHQEDGKGSYWEICEDGYLKMSRIGRITAEDDEDAFSEMVRSKCCEKAYRISRFIKEIDSPSYSAEAILYAVCTAYRMHKNEFRGIFEKMLSDIVDIYHRFGGDKNDDAFMMCKRHIVSVAFENSL